MHPKHENQHWNRTKSISVLIMVLMVVLPLEEAYAQGIVDVPGQQFSNIAQDVISDITLPPSPEELIGEDILINVNHYDPPVIPTTLIEDQGANVFALLEGTPTNPTIEISGIRRVVSRPVKITSIPPNKPISIGPIQHIAPRREELSYNNLGYLVIPIRRIPREADVPDQIDIDMVSRIFFDVAAGLSIGPHEDVLVKQEYQSWLPNKEDHRFYAGYIRADDITPTTATFTLYDKNLNEFGTYTAKEGSATPVINTYRPGFASQGRVFDKLRIRVNEIRGRDDKVKLYVTQHGITEYRILSKGQHLAPDSTWYIDDIQIPAERTKETKIILKNDKQQSEDFFFKTFVEEAKIPFTTQFPQPQEKYWICPLPRDDQGNIIEPHFLNTNECPHGIEGAVDKQKQPLLSFTGTCEWVVPSGNEILDCQGVPLTQQSSPPPQQEATDPTEQAVKEIEQAVQEKCFTQQVREDLQACYDTTLKVINNLSPRNLKSTLRNRVYTIVVTLRSIFTQYQTELERQKEISNNPILATKSALLEQALAESDVLIELLETPEAKAEKIQDLTESQALQKAKQSYQRIIDEYPESDFAPRALFRLGKIYWLQEKNIPLALEAFEKIINDYDEEQFAQLQVSEGVSSNYIAKTIKDLKRMKASLIATQGIKDLREADGSIISVTIVDVEDVLPDSEAIAKIRVNGKEHTYHTGESITFDIPEALQWEIVTIKDSEVVLIQKTKEGKQLGSPEKLRTGSAKSLPKNKDEKVVVELLSANLQRETHITIEPAAEQAFSEAHYTLHLPIEKRPFGLPLFSESLDAEIAKTEKLLAKLDRIIQRATAIHETWIKFCYLTYGTLWLKNTFWFGKGKEAVARNKVNDIYKERYAQGDLNCEGLTLEPCILKNRREEYEGDLDLMNDIIGEFDSSQYDNFAKQFSGLDENYDDDKKTAYMYQRLHEEKGKTDERIAQKYYTALKSLKLRSTDESIVRAFYTEKRVLKDFNSLDQPTQNGIKEMIDRMPDLKAQVQNEYAPVYNKNKDAILKNYKNYQRKIQMENFFTTLKQNKNEGEKEIVEELEKIHFRQFATRTELPKDSIIRDPSDNTYKAITDWGIVTITDPAIEEKYKQDTFTAEMGDATFTFTKNLKVDPPKRIFTLGSSGPEKGRVEFVTVDALHYLQVQYADSGRVEKMYVYKRPESNSPIGAEFDVRMQEYNEMLTYAKSEEVKKSDPQLYDRLTQAQSCLTTINKKLATSSFKQGDKDVVRCADGTYSVGAATKAISTSCIDYMSPTDCIWLFNACDPVICPETRCNFGGDWQVENVVQTGIIGSTVLCMRNFPQVKMPVCITGIVAGLQNIRSIIAGYRECLITSKVEGRSIGICDKIRSFGICDILWREGIAIFNAKEGIFKAISTKIFGEPEGGGEYAAFNQKMENSINTMKFFTQSYAKNVFAQYNGGALPEIGAAICKSAIFGKAPGIGTFLDQITRPESPPQFTAFFEEIPYSDVPDKPISLYNIFYHIYAGANQDVRFSLFLQIKDLTGQQVLPPLYIFRNRPLPHGEFASESLSLQRPAGYQEICMEIDSPNYGRDVQCGFGKVSTSFALNWINDQFTQSEIRKNIDSEEECTPSTGRITSLQYQGGGEYSGEGGAARIGVGSFSTGFLQTGIVRKCSQYDPDVGTTQDNWVPIGTCGKDDRGRNLGECYIHKPSAVGLIKDVSDRKDIKGDLDKRTQQIIQEIQKELPGPQYWICPLPRDDQGNIIEPHFLNANECPHGIEGAVDKQKPPQMSFTGTCEWIVPSGNEILKCKGIEMLPLQFTPELMKNLQNTVTSERSTEEDIEQVIRMYSEIADSLYGEKEVTETVYWLGRAYERLAQLIEQSKEKIVQKTEIAEIKGPALQLRVISSADWQTEIEEKISMENRGSETAKNVILGVSLKTFTDRALIPNFLEREKKTQIKSIPLGNIAPGEKKEQKYTFPSELIRKVNKYRTVFEYSGDNIKKQTLETEWKYTKETIPKESQQLTPLDDTFVLPSSKGECELRAFFYRIDSQGNIGNIITELNDQTMKAFAILTKKIGTTAGCTTNNKLELHLGNQIIKTWYQGDNKIKPEFSEGGFLFSLSPGILREQTGTMKLYLIDNSGQNKYNYPIGWINVNVGGISTQ